MRYQEIRIADLKTVSDCMRATAAIENDSRNAHKAGATRKLEAIERKEEKLYAAWLEANPESSVIFGDA